jgi:two-component system chemotaxis sensor kinase CheA
MDETRSGLFNTFREEVDTHLLRLQQGVVALEQNPANAELLKEVFRSAHTIKGSARMMGFREIVDVTHAMESVLGAMRDAQLRLTSEISDLLFEGIDAITVLTQLQANPHDAQAAQARGEMNLERLVAGLQAIADSTEAAPTHAANGAAANGTNGAGGAPNGTANVDPEAQALEDALAGPSHVLGLPRPDLHTARPDMPTLKLGEDTVRVRVQKLDMLMHLSGEMIITKMQHQAIVDRIQALLELERSRARRLATLTDMVQRSWGTINQDDMETALADLHHADNELDELTGRAMREFQEYAGRLNNVADELESTVLSVRMLPIDTLFSTFPRMLRDFKRETGKEVELVVRGGETELDKQILEALADPFIHLLRNALDHGVEPPAQRVAAGKPPTGIITVHAYQQGTQVVIEVTDDGAGMHPEKLRQVAIQKNFITRLEAEKLPDEELLNLVFYPGFSTASIITDTSGRGVGMDVVKSTVEARLNGTVTLESEPGVGTRVAMRLPLTLATMKALLVRVGSQVFVLPSHTVEGGMDYIGLEDISLIENREVVRLKGRLTPLIRLEELLDLSRVESGVWLKDAGLQRFLLRGERPAHSSTIRLADEEFDDDMSDLFWAPVLGTGVRLQDKLPGVLVGTGDRQACFLVDELIDELDVVVKNLGPMLAKVDMAIGATILGNGRVVIILDVPGLLVEARNRSTRGQLNRAWRTTVSTQRPHILVVDDSITTRELEKSILENAGYDVDIAMDGREALTRLEVLSEGGIKPYDLLIVDIEMPHMDGLELTQKVKTHTENVIRGLPVIIVSSLASDAYKQRGIEVGAAAYITKGQFDQSHLLETIDLLIH